MYVCRFCGAASDVTAHGIAAPCPQRVEAHAAKLEVLTAERDYFAALADAVREPATQIPWPHRADGTLA